MAVAIIATDTWIQHLLFTGGQRSTPFGMVDGIWYGLVSGDGDASGGNITLNGSLSFDRKEDWVYILGNISSSRNTATSTDAFTQINTGPIIPTASAVTNPSFSVAGSPFAVVNNAIATTQQTTGGSDPRSGMPIFGDKRLAGTFLMCAAGYQDNVNGETYQMSVWGWLINYSGFFRGVRPEVG